MRDVGRIENEASSARALTAAETIDLRSKVHADNRCRGWDLVDFTDFMLATGLRIGEASAVTWDALDLDAGTVEVRGTVVRVKGVGLTIKWRPKSRSGYRTLELPDWAVETLRRRQANTLENEWNVVFTALLGASHVYRKTVATLMDAAGLSARQAADQLGHAKVSMTQDTHFGRKVARTGAAEVLEIFADRTQSG